MLTFSVSLFLILGLGKFFLLILEMVEVCSYVMLFKENWKLNIILFGDIDLNLNFSFGRYEFINIA